MKWTAPFTHILEPYHSAWKNANRDERENLTSEITTKMEEELARTKSSQGLPSDLATVNRTCSLENTLTSELLP